MSNSFNAVPGQLLRGNLFGANTSISNTISGVATNASAVGNAVPTSPVTVTGNKNSYEGKITQTEKLKSARARYADLSALKPDANGKLSSAEIANSRGSAAYIRLLTSPKQAAEYKSGKTQRYVGNKTLVGPGSVSNVMTNELVSDAGYDSFLITNVACSMNEKVQIMEVFGDNEVVYYFGRQPMIFNIAGMLIDSVDNNWLYDWLNTYSEFLRGSQTARNYELIKLVLPNMILTGTMLGFSWGQDASRDVDIPFQFQFLAKVIEPVTAISDRLISHETAKAIKFDQANSFVSQANVNSRKAQLQNLASIIQNPASTLGQKGAALGAVGSGLGGQLGSFLSQANGTLTSYKNTIDGWGKSAVGAINSVKTAPLFQTVNSTLLGIRTNLISPVYGVLTSLIKLVKNVTGAVNNVFNSLITPIRNIIRDVTNIGRQAIALVNTINSSIRSIGRNINSQIQGLKQDYKTAIKTLSQAAGTIAAAPTTVSQSIKDMFSSGVISSQAAFLSSTPKKPFVRASLLVLGRPPITKINLLTSTPVYSPVTANSLS